MRNLTEGNLSLNCFLKNVPSCVSLVKTISVSGIFEDLAANMNAAALLSSPSHLTLAVAPLQLRLVLVFLLSLHATQLYHERISQSFEMINSMLFRVRRILRLLR